MTVSPVPSTTTPRSQEHRRDALLFLVAALLPLAVYLATLAPSVLPGDIAELQYVPAQLGIPHPNGYPLYLLLGKAWSSLPLGSLAWRMNLLSAVLGAAGVGLSYLFLRAAGLQWPAALAGAWTWAFQLTYWTYAGVAHRYTLLMLLGTGSLLALLAWRQRGQDWLLLLAALLAGLGLASHIASPLFLVPAAVLLLWPGRQARLSLRLIALAVLLFLLPLLLYALIPLKGSALWRGSPVDPIFGQPAVVLHGLVHPRFAPDAATLRAYFTAGEPVRLGDLFATALGHTWILPELVRSQIGLFWLILGGAGLALALRRSPMWGTALISLLLVDLLLAFYYQQGNVEAYFLPAAFVLVAAVAEVAELILRLASRLPRPQAWTVIASVSVLLLPLGMALRNAGAANQSQSLVLDRYWRTVLDLPLESGAGLIAHWSDLTPFWYFQQAEDRRPDLLGLYLPEVERLEAALAAGRTLYLAGPLSGWYERLPEGTQLIPWGPLVQLSHGTPASPQGFETSTPIDAVLGGQVILRSLSLLSSDPEATGTLPVALTWHSLAPVSRDLHISFRLRQEDRQVAQQDDRVISPWFPAEEVQPGLDFWSLHYLAMPPGLPAGDYALEAVVYQLDGPELAGADGRTELSLGSIAVPAGPPAGPGFLPRTSILPCLTLVSATPDRLEAPMGATIEPDLLWQVHCEPAQPVSLRYTLQDADDNQIITTTALAVQAGPSGWQPGQQLRTRTRLRLPPAATPGPYRLLVQGIDSQSDRDLARRLGPFPVPGAQEIATLEITGRDYVMELPNLAHAVDVSFGPALKLAATSGLAPELVAGQPLTVTLAWQALAPVDSSYSVFLHLLGPDGTIAAQRDTIPRAGALPTDLWLPGEVVVDSYMLSPKEPLAPGTYTLVVGLYDPRTMQRLPAASGTRVPLGDHVELGKLTVE
jgi:hypothetical protein